MPPRSRELDQRYWVSGSYFNYLANPTTSTAERLQGVWKTMDDVTGNQSGANPLTLIQRSFSVGRISGSQSSPTTGNLLRKLDGYPMGSATAAPSATLAYPTPGTLEKSNLAWEIMAATNPSQTHVNVPAMGLEGLESLWRVPAMMRDFTGSVYRAIAAGNVSWQFAVKPLINDLRKLCSFTDETNRRFRELRKAQKDGVIRKRCPLRQGESTTAWKNIVLNSVGATVFGKTQSLMSYEMWGSAEWLLDRSVELPKDDPSLVKMLRKSVTGLDARGALEAAWELTPWSWYVDWFAGIGTMLAATANRLPFTTGRLCVMLTRTNTNVYDIRTDVAQPTWVTISGLPSESEVRKERFPVVTVLPFVPSYLPILTNGQWSILSSLAVLGLTPKGPRPRRAYDRLKNFWKSDASY